MSEFIELKTGDTVAISQPEFTSQPEVNVKTMKMLIHMQEMQMRWLEREEEDRIAKEKELRRQEEREIEKMEKEQRFPSELMKELADSKREKDTVKLPKPVLQKFTEEDDVASFLDMFERVASLHKCPKTMWATQLSGVFSGKALKAFSSLPTEKSMKYDKVKHAILQRYNVNSETYRLRNDSYKPGESHHEYFNRLEEHYQRWTKSQEMELRDLIILEQFLHGVSIDLSVWLKERKPKSAKEAAQVADDYVLSRGTKPPHEKLRRSQRLQDEPAVKVTQEKQQSSRFFFRAPPSEVRNIPPRSKTNTQDEKQCYNCKKWGHIATVCPQRPTTPNFKADAKPAFVSESCRQRVCNPSNSKYMREGRIEGKDVKMLVDTGCYTTIVKADLVENE